MPTKKASLLGGLPSGEGARPLSPPHPHCLPAARGTALAAWLASFGSRRSPAPRAARGRRCVAQPPPYDDARAAPGAAARARSARRGAASSPLRSPLRPTRAGGRLKMRSSTGGAARTSCRVPPPS
eukprot:scaffold561_cov306-Prasinococcus_capsulatus_cf.AAC.3